MKADAKTILEQLARAKNYFNKYEVDRAFLAYATALKLFTQGKVTGPQKTTVQGTIREVTGLLNRTEEVQEHLKALVYKPGEEKQLFARVAGMIKKMQDEAEQESYEEAQARKLALDKALLRGGRLLEAKKIDEALEAFKEAESYYRDEHKLFCIICRQCVQNGFPRQGIPFCRRAMEITPEDREPYILTTNAYLTAGDHKNALALISSAIKKFGEDAELRAWLAHALLRSGRLKDAAGEAAKALDIDPMEPFARKVMSAIRKAAKEARK